jgi:hypothetical protein
MIVMTVDKMSGRCVTLSAKGLTNIVRENYQNDFKFIFGGQDYDCPFFVAEFLSRRISNYRRNDCTISEIEIESKDASNCFAKFISLGFGSSVSFELSDYAFIRSICIELESIELYESLFLRSEELSEQNVIERLKCCELIGCSCENEIEFAASHFFVFDESSISELSVSMILKIMGEKSLKLKSEDSLYKMISSLISTDSCYSVLLECVEYEYLSRDSIESFINIICESFEFLTLEVWHHLRSRLISGPSSSLSGRCDGQVFEYREGSSFDGIISFLTRQHGGNIHDLGIVSVTSSSVNGGRVAKNVVDFNSLSIGQTNGEPNGWICFDFKEKRVNVHHYSIRSRNDYDLNHPINWMLEGSVDGTEWVELDRQNNCGDLVGLNRSKTFSGSGNEFFQLIRLRQTGKNGCGDDYLTVSAIELFGTLRTF